MRLFERREDTRQRHSSQFTCIRVFVLRGVLRGVLSKRQYHEEVAYKNTYTSDDTYAILGILLLPGD